MRVVSTYGGRGDVESVVDVAVRPPALRTVVGGCAPLARAGLSADVSEGGRPGTRTPLTRDSTEWEVPVTRPATAAQRSTAASEVMQ